MRNEYVFVCPNCAERIRVDAEVRNELLCAGCPVCGTDVGGSSFGDHR